MRIMVWILNLLERRRRFRTVWVEDLPPSPERDALYVIGEREHPSYLAVACRRRDCRKLIHLEISKDFKPRWKLAELPDGSLTVTPSIRVVDSSCRCHFWVRKGHVVWSEFPPLRVPEENRVR